MRNNSVLNGGIIAVSKEISTCKLWMYRSLQNRSKLKVIFTFETFVSEQILPSTHRRIIVTSEEAFKVTIHFLLQFIFYFVFCQRLVRQIKKLCEMSVSTEAVEQVQYFSPRYIFFFCSESITLSQIKGRLALVKIYISPVTGKRRLYLKMCHPGF